MRFLLLAGFLLLLVAGCGARPASREANTLVFKTSRIPGGPEAWGAIVAGFEREHPGWRVVTESLPNSSDEQHQFYAINLDARSSDFDVFGVDVVWGQEFARAGWLLDLTNPLGPAAMEELEREYFPGCVEPCLFRGRCYGMPWFMDAGLLYYRTDLLSKYGLGPPATYGELEGAVQKVIRGERDPGLAGFVWQGKQYEGLVCAALEFVRGFGGDVLRDGRPALATGGAVEALETMRRFVASGVSPPMVTNGDEEATRRLFGDGRAVFMRNWPYAWSVLQGERSAVRGKVGIAPVPAGPAGKSSPTLGGWQYAVNRFTRHPAMSVELVRYLTRPEVQEQLILTVGFNPGRRSLYARPKVLESNPFLAKLTGSLEKAVPRPLTPFYPMISQVLQSAFSAAVAGIRSPREALRQADEQIARIVAIETPGETP